MEVRAPPKLVPPEKEVTATRRWLHALRIVETSRVERGKKTVTGVSWAGTGECGVLAFEARTAGSVEWSMLWLLREDIRFTMLSGDVSKWCGIFGHGNGMRIDGCSIDLGMVWR